MFQGGSKTEYKSKSNNLKMSVFFYAVSHSSETLSFLVFVWLTLGAFGNRVVRFQQGKGKTLS